MEQIKELEFKELAPLPLRIQPSHKYTYGSLLIIGGSIGYLGAPQLSAEAAFKSGVGLVSIALPVNLYFSFKPETLSTMIFPYQTENDLKRQLSNKDAVLFGPGLNQADPLNEAVLKMLLAFDIPLIIDAGGLDVFKKVADHFSDFSRVVITPHLGEATRLLDGLAPLNNYNRLLKNNLSLVLKGAKTIIAKEQEEFLASRGTAAMAKAGMGDVLSGIIAALLAQGYSPIEAAKMGVYVHQSAALKALETNSEISLMSEDVLHALPAVWDELIVKNSL